MSITVQCPKGHFVAKVDITETGLDIHADRCGLVWLYAPKQEITRVHARCLSRHCTYDGSLNYRALWTELTRIEHSGRGDDVGVVIRGLARATTLSVDQLLALSATGLLENTVFGIDGKIRPAFRRTMSGAEARAKLAERRSDGSPRKRCSACGECFTDAWECYCSRLRRPGEMPYGGWPTVSASMVRRTCTTPSPPSARP